MGLQVTTCSSRRTKESICKRSTVQVLLPTTGILLATRGILKRLGRDVTVQVAAGRGATCMSCEDRLRKTDMSGKRVVTPDVGTVLLNHLPAAPSPTRKGGTG